MEAGAVVRVGLGIVGPTFPAKASSSFTLVLLENIRNNSETCSSLLVKFDPAYPRVHSGLGVKVPLLHLRDLPFPQVVDEQFDEGLGGVAPVTAVAVLLHGMLQFMTSAHVAVEEAVLAQVVVDAS